MDITNPEDLTLEQIKEQIAMYSRLYYQKRKNDKEFMDRKRINALKTYRRKQIDKQMDEVELKDKEYQDEEHEVSCSIHEVMLPSGSIREPVVKKTKPRKYNITKIAYLETK